MERELAWTSERPSERDGKGKGGFDEQRWWDDWWAMKELSGDDLEMGDLGQRLRDEKWEEVRSRRLRNAGMRMAERLGEEMASELRMAECWGEETRDGFHGGGWRKGSRRPERRRRMRGPREEQGEWENSAWENNRGGLGMLEEQIEWMMRRIEGLENERNRDEDWRMARVEWLNEVDRGMWMGDKGRTGRERRKRKERCGERESSDEGSEGGRRESLEERIRELVERIEGSDRVGDKRKSKGSSSDGDGGNGKWRWDGENWWCKVEFEATINSKLRRRISRSVREVLEQEMMRRREKGQWQRSEIEWLEQRKQQRGGQGNLRTSGDPACYREKGPGSSWEGQFM